MNTSQAEEVLKQYLEDNYAQIRDIGTRQVVVRAMHYFAALAVSEAKDENIAMVKAIKNEDIKGSIEPYLQNEKDAFFVRVGAMWMRDEILKRL